MFSPFADNDCRTPALREAAAARTWGTPGPGGHRTTTTPQPRTATAAAAHGHPAGPPGKNASAGHASNSCWHAQWHTPEAPSDPWHALKAPPESAGRLVFRRIPQHNGRAPKPTKRKVPQTGGGVRGTREHGDASARGSINDAAVVDLVVNGGGGVGYARCGTGKTTAPKAPSDAWCGVSPSVSNLAAAIPAAGMSVLMPTPPPGANLANLGPARRQLFDNHVMRRNDAREGSDSESESDSDDDRSNSGARWPARASGLFGGVSDAEKTAGGERANAEPQRSLGGGAVATHPTHQHQHQHHHSQLQQHQQPQQQWCQALKHTQKQKPKGAHPLPGSHHFAPFTGAGESPDSETEIEHPDSITPDSVLELAPAAVTDGGVAHGGGREREGGGGSPFNVHDGGKGGPHGGGVGRRGPRGGGGGNVSNKAVRGSLAMSSPGKQRRMQELAHLHRMQQRQAARQAALGLGGSLGAPVETGGGGGVTAKFLSGRRPAAAAGGAGAGAGCGCGFGVIPIPIPLPGSGDGVGLGTGSVMNIDTGNSVGGFGATSPAASMERIRWSGSGASYSEAVAPASMESAKVDESLAAANTAAAAPAAAVTTAVVPTGGDVPHESAFSPSFALDMLHPPAFSLCDAGGSGSGGGPHRHDRNCGGGGVRDGGGRDLDEEPVAPSAPEWRAQRGPTGKPTARTASRIQHLLTHGDEDSGGGPVELPLSCLEHRFATLDLLSAGVGTEASAEAERDAAAAATAMGGRSRGCDKATRTTARTWVSTRSTPAVAAAAVVTVGAKGAGGSSPASPVPLPRVGAIVSSLFSPPSAPARNRGRGGDGGDEGGEVVPTCVASLQLQPISFLTPGPPHWPPAAGAGVTATGPMGVNFRGESRGGGGGGEASVGRRVGNGLVSSAAFSALPCASSSSSPAWGVVSMMSPCSNGGSVGAGNEAAVAVGAGARDWAGGGGGVESMFSPPPLPGKGGRDSLEGVEQAQRLGGGRQGWTGPVSWRESVSPGEGQ